MKRRPQIILACLIFASTAWPCNARQVLVFATATRAPLSYPDQSGFLDRITSECLNQLGYELEIDHLPAERALLNANAGIDDGDLNRIAGLEEKYTNLMQVPESTIDTEFVAFTRSTNLTIHSWDGLSNKTVGIIRGWKILEQNIPADASIVTVKNQDQLFLLLANDRVDVILTSKWIGLHYIKQNGLSGFIIHEPALASMKMHVYFNKKHAALVHKFSAVLQQSKQNGTYQRIFNESLGILNQ